MDNNNKVQKKKASDLKKMKEMDAQARLDTEAFDLEQEYYKEKWRKQDEEMKLFLSESLKNEESELNALFELEKQVLQENQVLLGQLKDSRQPTYNPTKLDISLHGGVNSKMLCQQCGERGFIHTKTITRKVGVSGGKATAAFLTAGLSLFALGLSRKESNTEAYCGNCKSQWFF